MFKKNNIMRKLTYWNYIYYYTYRHIHFYDGGYYYNEIKILCNGK